MWVEKHGKTYRIRERMAGEKITLADGYPTKKSAQDAMILMEADKLRGDQLVPRGGKLSLGDWIDTWWPVYEANLKPSARVSAAGIVRRYIRPMLGHLALEELDPMVVQRWTADLLAGRTPARKPKPLAPKTVRNAHGQLHRIMSDAVRNRLVRANPCEGTGLPRMVREEMRFLTEAEAQQLLAAVPLRWQPLVLLLLLTGLRWSEAVGLRVGRVDVERRRLTVVTQLQELSGGGELVEVEPKSRRSRRTVTFPGRLALVLVDLVAGRGRDDLVFTTVGGLPVRYRAFWRRVWMPACRRAGLEGLRLHDLRHTHATWLISAGVPALAISRRLGHASIAVTMDLYGHLLPEVDGTIVVALDDALDRIDGLAGDHGGSLGAPVEDGEGVGGSQRDESAGDAGDQAA